MKRWLFTLFTLLAPAVIQAEDGLIGQWSFDDDPAGVVKNTVNDRTNAKTNKDFPRVEGVYGKAAELSGGCVIEIPADGLVPSRMKQLTFSAWIAPSKFERFANIFRKEDASGPVQNRLLFGIQEDGKYLALGICTGGNYDECDGLLAPEELLDGQWHYVAGTFDGKMMRVYLDGKEIGSYERQSPQIDTASDFRPLNRYWHLEGRFQDIQNIDTDKEIVNRPAYIGSSEGKSEFFNGKLDDVRFYSRALNAGEIQCEYRKGIKNPPAAKPCEAEAAKLYVKGGSFMETLCKTRDKVAEKNGLDAMTNVALTRLIRNGYPAEMNTFMQKKAIRWQPDRSPVDYMTWNAQRLYAHANSSKDQYSEYLPLTEDQWKFLSADQRQHWEKVKANLVSLGEGEKTPAAKLFEIVMDIEIAIEHRPNAEKVAGRMEANTPEVRDFSAEEAKNILEREWLFQCGGQPTVDRSKQEIGWAKAMAARIVRQYPGKVDYSGELKKLDELEASAASKNGGDQDRDLYFAVRTVKREITFKNPVIDFDSVLYVDGVRPGGSEADHETRHRLGYMARSGGRLMTLKGLKPDGHQTKLMPQEPLHGAFWRPDLSYDGKRVLVGFHPHNEKTFHIYETGIDGSGTRQLTSGMFDDFDPVYLPDGKNFMFLTTRGHIYVRCMPPTNAFVLARMSLDTKPGDKNLYIISRNGEPEYTPSVMHDGRVIYTRWEYTDKPLWRCQSLWTMNSDGTQVQTFWGNQSVWPDLLKDARSIPGSEKVMFTGAGHHNWFAGSIGIIDPGKGFNFPDGLTKVTQEIAWPETGNGPVDPAESGTYHTAGGYDAYYSPYPLSEKDFMVSARRRFVDDTGKVQRNNSRWDMYVLLLMDTDGNRELITVGAHNIFDAQPIRPRKVPQVLADRVEWPAYENRHQPGTGTIYSNNVYENAPPELKDKAKYLRIFSIEHKTYTYWYKRNYASSGPEISPVQSEGIKKIIGTVPIEEDGSVSFKAPTGIALHFQLLDENLRALQTMKSFTGVLPGETRGCLGCHESMTRTPVSAQTGRALKQPPRDITPVPWEDITVGYERYVQPVIDKHCGKCHQDPKSPAFQKWNATLRPGALGFKEPYLTLIGNPTWATEYRYTDKGNRPAPFGWANIIMVEGYGTNDPRAYATYPAMTRLSYKSRLIDRMTGKDEHNGVKVTGNELHRVILWIDAMAPYYGAEELRCMEDPIFPGAEWLSQRPRIATAPIVQRPGPFDPFYPDPAYDAPKAEQYNALPAGMERKK
ncbi:MAG: hypothetical protein LBH00_03145 [Planctomycetaceae bacterium]|jgi:hypothetical protein|nr:hypothetical protein [Planctomycetaceae bacterium]